MIVSLKQALPEHYNCIARDARLGESQRAMLQYYAGITAVRDPGRVCELRLVQGDKVARPLLDESRYRKIWEGNRKTDKNERYRLYQRID
jgi:hypothetical protein